MRAGSFGLKQGRSLHFGIHSLAGCSCSNLLVFVACVCLDGHCIGRYMEHHVAGRPQGGGDVFLKCDRCCEPVRGPNGGCSWGFQLDEMMGDSVGKESSNFPGLGPCQRHAEVGNSQGQVGKHGIAKFEVEFLDRLEELELQVRVIRSENLEYKKVMSRLYTLAPATHSEVKTQNSKVAEKIEHLEETLGLSYPRKARKSKATSSELEDIDGKMEKLKKFTAHAGNFVDLSSEKNVAGDSAGIVMDMGLQ